ncbi:MAG: MBL fold metallo-hydrolase [Burkholderiales bacterium]|nr:MBL fold metallo-hydrolase [Burkholderiales bacterium]
MSTAPQVHDLSDGRGGATRLRLTHYGAAAWSITDGGTRLLVDPFFSRIRYADKGFGTSTPPAAPGDTRPVFGPNDTLSPDAATLALMERHVERADYIFTSHSHFNHCMDMPCIAKKTGATVVGTESTTNIARAHGVPEGQLVTVKGGEDFEFGAFSVKVIPSLHSALSSKHYFDSGTVPRDIRAPMRLVDYVEGNTLAYFFRLGEHRVIVFCSMNYIEREIAGLKPTAALVPAAKARLEIHDYTGRLLRGLGLPPVVIATHWDVQSWPYGAAQDAAYAQAETFLAEVRKAAPGTRVVIPRHFDTVEI